MGHRPLPTFARGPKRLRKFSPQLLVGCPRISPQWELLVVSTLMKPKPHKHAELEHKRAEQPWRAGAAEHLRDVIDEAARRLDLDSPFHWPEQGEYFVVGEWPTQEQDSARGVALAMSVAMPELWWVVGRLFVKAGRFYRRRRGYEMELTLRRTCICHVSFARHWQDLSDRYKGSHEFDAAYSRDVRNVWT